MVDHLIPRRVRQVATESMDTFRAVVVHGARQVGKSTLVEQIATELGARMSSLDDEIDLRLALDDPGSYLADLGRPAVIDEIQRAGDRLLLAIKSRLDHSRAAGQYLLTGSTNFLTTPQLSETLAGRIDIVTLWPLSMGEALEGNDDFVDRAFAAPLELVDHSGSTPNRVEYLNMVCRGGYPEVQRMSNRPRDRWFDQYLDTVLLREVETAADLRRIGGLRSLARLLLSTTGSELVISRLANDLRLDRATVEAYAPWLETAFLVHRLPAWGRNVTTKVVHRPKLHACDTGLAAGVLGKSVEALSRLNDPSTGTLVESFVVAELAKQLTWSTTRASLHHLRESNGLEIDVIVETRDGRVLAIEVKASTVPRPEDAAALASLRDRLDRVGSDFAIGVVFHTGARRVVLGDRLVGLPIADLWT